jgi:mono/diheme cytochrome c family protein
MKINIAFLVITILIISACGGKKQKVQSANDQNSGTPEITQEPSPTIPANHPGKQVYNSVCLACHMADGSGVPGMHPPLIETEWVSGDKERLIKLVLEGMSGKIEVDGETYNSLMPPHSHLTDKQIADVLTYIRKSFGNNASEITTQEVQQVRNSN